MLKLPPMVQHAYLAEHRADGAARRAYTHTHSSAATFIDRSPLPAVDCAQDCASIRQATGAQKASTCEYSRAPRIAHVSRRAALQMGAMTQEQLSGLVADAGVVGRAAVFSMYLV